jgi:hypothetical protein
VKHQPPAFSRSSPMADVSENYKASLLDLLTLSHSRLHSTQTSPQRLPSKRAFMRERTLETAADTPATPPTPAMRKRRCIPASLCPTHPAPRVAGKEFWAARMREILSFECNPWDFYEPFLKLGLGPSLVLCNNGTGIRVIRTFSVASKCDEVYCFPEI